MKFCSYCGKNASLTREHIWPSCLIEKYESLLTYSKRESKFYNGDPTVKDVCAHCNNVVLSKLDSYLSSLYDEHFNRILLPGEDAFFSYDYELLLRALLKISYNSARADASEKVVKAHQGFIRFILQGGHCPHITLRLQIVTAARAVNLDEGTEKIIEPRHLRCAEIPYDGPLSHRFVVRMIAINCYWFFLALSHKIEPPHKWKEFEEGLTNWRMNLGVRLPYRTSELTIPVNKTTYLHPGLLGNLARTFEV